MLRFNLLIHITFCIRSDPQSPLRPVNIDSVLHAANLQTVPEINSSSTAVHLPAGRLATSSESSIESLDPSENPRTLRNLPRADSLDTGLAKQRRNSKEKHQEFGLRRISAKEDLVKEQKQGEQKDEDVARGEGGLVEGALALVGCITSLAVGWAATMIYFTVKNSRVKAGGIAGLGVMYVVIMTVLTLFWLRVL